MAPPVRRQDETQQPLIDPGRRPAAGDDDDSSSLRVRLAASSFSFAVFGLLASTNGVIVPHLERHFGLSDLHVSLLFLVAPPCYMAASAFNGLIHLRLGQRGVAVAGALFHASYPLIALASCAGRLPFWLFLVGVALSGVGNGLLDGSFSAWAAGLRRGANTAQGLLHGAFSVGAGVGPFLAGAMMDRPDRPWWEWYYVLAAATIIALTVMTFAFRHEDAAQYHRQHKRDDEGEAEGDGEEGGGDDGDYDHWRAGAAVAQLAAALRHPVTWICAAYFICYMGTEGVISGWVVAFMARARGAPPLLASSASSAFWITEAAGRLTLGTVADRIGVRAAAAAFFCGALALQLLFATAAGAPGADPHISMAVIAMTGFLMGPLFPSGIVMVARLLPADLHVVAVSFAMSIGQLGSGLFPFGVGALINAVGIRVFPVAVISATAISLAVWLSFPTVAARRR